MVPDSGQPYVFDPNLPDVTGYFHYVPLEYSNTSDAIGCRCIKDPLYVLNDYDFPTEFFTDEVIYQSFKDGLDNPNSYHLVKSDKEEIIQIPINKAFSIQSEYLNNKEALKATNYNNLKINVLWTTNTNLINKIALSNKNISSLVGINNTNINVEINANQSGNAVISLHNGSVINPIYWSWHIWVTDNEIQTIRYATNNRNISTPNYINYVKGNEHILDTDFMDRNLGAIDFFPTVTVPTSPSAEELQKIKVSGGLQYQWGRKDPLPSFTNPDGSNQKVYLGKSSENGTISYTELESNTYLNASGDYVVTYNQFSTALPTDKIAEKVSKNLLYSVQNPLVYMVPSTFSPLNVKKLHTNGADWLIDDVNIGADRWGRGDKKSPFDPCPEGWRIPDVTFTEIKETDTIKTKGISPWYKKGNIISENPENLEIIENYKGKGIVVNGKTVGFNFNDPEYNIGNYPFVGVRGFRRVTQGQVANFDINESYSGVWLSSLLNHSLGRATNLLMDRDLYHLAPYYNTLDPYAAMNCRCVKVKTTSSGEEGGFPRMPIPPYISARGVMKLTSKEVQVISKKSINVYPNPVNDILNINGNDKETYYYQIYDMTGILISQGKFNNNKINISSFRPGIYLIRINDSKELTKIIKK